MNARRLRQRLLIGLLAAAFVFSCWQIVGRVHATGDPRQLTLRFSHWQLEPGVREAFDALARDYERLHPGVRVEQLLIPENIFRQWSMTQLAGGTAPDLMQVGKGINFGGSQRYFVPITAEASQPNPYNAGTALAEVPWRNTFNDGMESGLDPETLECYTATLFTSSIRIFYNADLMREITGSEESPATFDAMVQLGERVRAFARANGRDLVPIGGSSLSGNILCDALFQNQTQRLATALNPATGFPLSNEEFALAYLNRQWTLADPAVHGAVGLIAVAGSLMPPGFMQTAREQANMLFVQGRALMMLGFSVEARGLLRQAGFKVRAFRCPTPGREDPRFGPQQIAPAAESGLSHYGGFGITRASRHPQQALDFLQFLTSEAGCRKYAHLSLNLPVITTVEVPPDLRDFTADRRGFPAGPYLGYASDARQVFSKYQHFLLGPQPDPGEFLEKVRRELGDAMRRDAARGLQLRQASIRRTESAIPALRQLQSLHPDDSALVLKYQSLTEAQNELEAQVQYTRLRLQQAAAIVDAP